MASPEDSAMAELETVEEEEVLRRLGTGEEAGLTDKEAARRLRLHGPNVVVRSHQEDSILRKFLMNLFSLWGWNHAFPKYRNMVRVILNSMSWVTVLTTIVSLTIASASQRSYMLSITIYLLATSLIVCLTVRLVEEYAKAPLEEKAYTPRAKVLRDGMWINMHAANLVPGDIIFLKVGDIVPANARILRFQKIDTMTCWAKRSVDCVHASSYIMLGLCPVAKGLLLLLQLVVPFLEAHCDSTHNVTLGLDNLKRESCLLAASAFLL